MLMKVWLVVTEQEILYTGDVLGTEDTSQLLHEFQLQDTIQASAPLPEQRETTPQSQSWLFDFITTL